MACCGKKRSEWLNHKKSANNQANETTNSNSSEKEKTDRIFEYTGMRSLSIKGSISGKLYNFKFRGDKLEVDYDDSWALMAERDLKFVK